MLTDGGATWTGKIIHPASCMYSGALDPDGNPSRSGGLIDFTTDGSSACTNPSSWSEVQVAGPFDLHQAPVAGGELLGDYQGLTTSGNAFQPFFIQAVTAPSNPTDAYFDSIP